MLQIVKHIPLVSTTANVKRTVGWIHDFWMNTSLRVLRINENHFVNFTRATFALVTHV